MMSIHCVVRSRIDPQIKAEAIQVFDHMGLTLSEAIRLFLYQSVAEKRIPFSINIPNATTRAALEAIERKEGLEETSLAQLTKDWDDACAR
ncbi:MAG: type II toxin-antitoxin system RelB/DinJ family antitoxin [Gammaproteobacteria bacterium]|nr:type II toxin-antitoxin system RelB/DinJ family antitoxin [Gammaproteobacteria bacterium]